MESTIEHFIFSLKNDYYFLTLEDTFTLALRGMEKKPLNLADFSLPVTKSEIYGFCRGNTPAISLDGNKVNTDSFWELLVEVLKEYT